MASLDDSLASHRLLPDDDWISAMIDPGTPLSFPLYGYDTVDRDWAFRDRRLADHLMYLPVGGSCVGEIEGSPLSLRAGSHLWMRPGARHTFTLGEADAPFTLYFVRFRIGLPGGELSLRGRTHRQWEGAWELQELMDQLVDELNTTLVHREARLRGLLVSICSAALRHGSDDSPADAGTLTRAQRRAIEVTVREDPARRITPPELAELIGLSPDYFTRLFTRTFGVPPRVWLVRERLRRGARSLAETLQNVSEISTSLGYDDIGAFSHQFKQRYGVSPRAYRRQQR